MRMKEESEKAGLKFNIEKTKVMASSSITSWQTDGGKMETVSGFIFLGSKITVDYIAATKLKKFLAPWKKSYDKSKQHIKKQRYRFSNKGLDIQS